MNLGEQLYSKTVIEALKGAGADAAAEGVHVQVHHLLTRLLSTKSRVGAELGDSLEQLSPIVTDLPKEEIGRHGVLSQPLEVALKLAQDYSLTEELSLIHSRHVCLALLTGLGDQNSAVRVAVEILSKSKMLDPVPILPDTCTGCGWSSPVRAAFQSESPLQGEYYCLACFRQNERKRLMKTRWAVGFALAGTALLVGATAGTEFSLYLQYLGYICVALVVGIGLHELGHAIAARFLGFQIDLVRVGLGRRLASLRVFNTRFDVNVFPVAGLTLVHPGFTCGRLKWILMYLAGPVANAAIAGVVYFFATAVEVNEGPLVVFFFVNLWLALANLIPFVDQGQDCSLPSDGLAIIQVLLGREEKLARFRQFGIFLKANEFYENEQFDKARELVVDALDHSPEDDRFLDMYGAILIELGHIDEARALYGKLLSNDENPIRLNNLAWCSFLDGVDIPKAIEQAKRALELEPRMGFGFGTLGCLYLREKLHREALDALQQALKYNRSPRSLACNACYAAVASGYLGDMGLKANYIRLARVLNP